MPCRAGGGDCGAPGQDKTAEVDDDERDLHRVRTVADLKQTFYFFDGQIKRPFGGRGETSAAVDLGHREHRNWWRFRTSLRYCIRI